MNRRVLDYCRLADAPRRLNGRAIWSFVLSVLLMMYVVNGFLYEHRYNHPQAGRAYYEGGVVFWLPCFTAAFVCALTALAGHRYRLRCPRWPAYAAFCMQASFAIVYFGRYAKL